MMYMLKTPLFMGTPHKVLAEASNVEVSPDDLQNQTLKNFLLTRALTLQNDFEALKSLLQSLLQSEGQAASVQPLSMFVQYCAQNVTFTLPAETPPLTFHRKSTRTL